MGLDPTLLQILACPEDKGPLLYFRTDEFLYNPRLHRKYEVREGIPVMLIEEAISLDDAEHERLMGRVADEGIEPTFIA
jgi:uncharacterized protein YbaR (Trm112 family)